MPTLTTVITRVRYSVLYERLKQAAYELASGDLEFIGLPDEEGLPMVAKSYNEAIDRASGDVLVFCHDDAYPDTPGWDKILREELKTYSVVGPVGTDKYRGGSIVSEGHPHCFGRYLTTIDGQSLVKIFSGHTTRDMVAVDGMFMACSADYARARRFDEKLDGLFFYDLDFCLGSRCGITEVLVGHSKPAEYYGNYPERMKSMEYYEDYFHKKHGIEKREGYGDMRCAAVTPMDFYKVGQDRIFADFRKEYLECSVS